jgi:hypothetical protein
MKRLIIIAVIVCLVFAILIFAKDSIAKSILIQAARQVTGLGCRIENMELSLLKGQAEIAGLSIFNPEGFSDRLMADIPRVYIDFDLAGLFFKKKVHIQNLVLDLREFIVIKNPDARLNIKSISGISGAGGSAAQSKKPAARKPDIKIDLFQLKVGRVLYKDYAQAPASVIEFPVKIDERYENITDINKLVKLIVARALVNTAISRLADIDFSRLQSDISNFIQKGQDIFKGAKSAEDIGQAVENAAKTLENIFKMPGEK